MTCESPSYLHSFRPLRVGELVLQKQGIDWLLWVLERSREGHAPSDHGDAVRLYQHFVQADYIESRATCLTDYRQHDASKMELFKAVGSSAWYRPPLEKRMEIFRKVATELVEAALAETEPPQYLIQVSCTGYDSPHATQRVASRKGWGAQTKLLHIGHMGCYAALPVSWMAGELIKANVSADARASLILIELCTLHLDPAATDAQQIVMNTLFADGAIRFDVSSQIPKRGFAVLDYREAIVPNTEKAMTWTLHDSAFLMSLGRTVPVQLARKIPLMVDELLKPLGISPTECLFAIHPGGPKIVELVAGALALSPEQTQHTRFILRTRGNMSSCTLPHIWNEILEDVTISAGTPVVSLGFGPGLTLAANLLRKVS